MCIRDSYRRSTINLIYTIDTDVCFPIRSMYGLYFYILFFFVPHGTVFTILYPCGTPTPRTKRSITLAKPDREDTSYKGFDNMDPSVPATVPEGLRKVVEENLIAAFMKAKQEHRENFARRHRTHEQQAADHQINPARRRRNTCTRGGRRTKDASPGEGL